MIGSPDQVRAIAAGVPGFFLLAMGEHILI